MAYAFVNVNDFTPNLGQWTSIGRIDSWSRSGNVFTLNPGQAGLALQLSILSPTCFRVRFNPSPNFDYSVENSYAVINRNLGAANVTIVSDTAEELVLATGALTIKIELDPYRILVYRNGQLINADSPSYNLVYIPGQQVIANFKDYPANARYCGFGEKAGSQLLKNEYTMTFFNFDNFQYASAPLPAGEGAGPLNPSEALYTSIPLLIENNPLPQGNYLGPAYSYGLFFDNPGQSYFNVGASDYSNMYGKYYFGALYGDMDYYFMAGDVTADVLSQYVQLTGRAPMPPRYVFGFHQGAYGYYDRYLLAVAANSYRAARIPLDGLHIDVDFQNNYRTFTSSEMKFPNTREMMDNLHTLGFKCSTNITPLVTDNPFDENGKVTPYAQRDSLLAGGALIYDTLAGEGPNPKLFIGKVSYGVNRGSNPYPVPPLQPNTNGQIPLGSNGNYSDYARSDVQNLWGEQYAHLIKDLGMDMIWQDMTDPALAQEEDTPFKTFPLGLQQDNGISYQPNATFHNAYAGNLLKATWEGLNRLRPDKRNFIIARGGYAGMQRYAGLWTGDSASSWDFLRINIPEVLNLGLSGIPISGCDIGGFATGSATTSSSYISGGKVMGGITNYELLTRWMQLGSFLPWYRNHYDGYNKQFQEAYAYGEPVPTNCRKYVELRYRMNQIYYDAMYECTQTGMPIARALFLNEPGDEQAYSHLDDQFFVGRDFLVAPIIDQHETLSSPTQPLRDVYLPSGSQWYAFQDNIAPLLSPVEGGQVIHNYYADLSLVPIYVRAGAILPMRELEQYIGELAINPLTFNIYPGPDSTHQLYLDDGISMDAADKSLYRLTEISHQGISGGQNIRIRRITDNYSPPEPFYYVALLGTRHPSSVSAAGVSLADVGNPATLASSPENAYYWNASIQITFIKIFDSAPDVTVTALYYQ